MATSIVFDNEGHKLKSAVENPVVVIIDATWKNDCCIALPNEGNVLRILKPITTVAIRIIPI